MRANQKKTSSKVSNMLTTAIRDKFNDFFDLLQALAPATTLVDGIFPPAFQALQQLDVLVK